MRWYEQVSEASIGMKLPNA